MFEDKDQRRIEEIIQKRFGLAPEGIKTALPPILQEEKLFWACTSTQSFFVLAFVDQAGRSKIEELVTKNYFPFPGLINDKSDITAAIELEASKNIYIKDCIVSNMFSLRLKEDSTVVLENHKQTIKTNELGEYEYVLQLAYIVSFGKEINPANLFDYLDGLIAYSIELWKSNRAGGNQNE
ncbi:MAG TPA: hypothetical protein VF398_04680 [bacterium]|jgi:hypothetical protein